MQEYFESSKDDFLRYFVIDDFYNKWHSFSSHAFFMLDSQHHENVTNCAQNYNGLFKKELMNFFNVNKSKPANFIDITTYLFGVVKFSPSFFEVYKYFEKEFMKKQDYCKDWETLTEYNNSKKKEIEKLIQENDVKGATELFFSSCAKYQKLWPENTKILDEDTKYSFLCRQLGSLSWLQCFAHLKDEIIINSRSKAHFKSCSAVFLEYFNTHSFKHRWADFSVHAFFMLSVKDLERVNGRPKKLKEELELFWNKDQFGSIDLIGITTNLFVAVKFDPNYYKSIGHFKKEVMKKIKDCKDWETLTEYNNSKKEKIENLIRKKNIEDAARLFISSCAEYQKLWLENRIILDEDTKYAFLCRQIGTLSWLQSFAHLKNRNIIETEELVSFSLDAEPYFETCKQEILNDFKVSHIFENWASFSVHAFFMLGFRNLEAVEDTQSNYLKLFKEQLNLFLDEDEFDSNTYINMTMYLFGVVKFDQEFTKRIQHFEKEVMKKIKDCKDWETLTEYNISKEEEIEKLIQENEIEDAARLFISSCAQLRMLYHKNKKKLDKDMKYSFLCRQIGTLSWLQCFKDLDKVAIIKVDTSAHFKKCERYFLDNFETTSFKNNWTNFSTHAFFILSIEEFEHVNKESKDYCKKFNKKLDSFLWKGKFDSIHLIGVTAYLLGVVKFDPNYYKRIQHFEKEVMKKIKDCKDWETLTKYNSSKKKEIEKLIQENDVKGAARLFISSCAEFQQLWLENRKILDEDTMFSFLCRQLGALSWLQSFAHLKNLN